MTLEDRLKAIGLDKQLSASAQEPPKANNLATLLTQGLQSEDKMILNVSTPAKKLNFKYCCEMLFIFTICYFKFDCFLLYCCRMYYNIQMKF